MERDFQVVAGCRLSWLAYFRPIFFGVFMILVALLLAELAEEKLLAGAGVVVAVLWLAYQFAFLRSVIIYADEKGVWMCRGFFPWQKAVVGVKWHDIDGAHYKTGFISWITRAYRVQVQHRYTKKVELVVDNVHNGHQLVSHINSALIQYAEGCSGR